MAVERGDWDKALDSRRADEADIALKTVLRQGNTGGSGAFLAFADGARYWVKPLNNLQHERVCVNDQIVGRAAARIGALTPTVRTARIPPELAGCEFRGDHQLEEGIAHASLAVNSAVEINVLANRDKDDNERHHAEFVALFDWCWGGDAQQWLVGQAAEERCFSHDHGHYFPGGPGWTAAGLEANVDTPNVYSYGGTAFSQEVLNSVAGLLEAVSRKDLISVLAAIPTSWPVTNAELETVGYFLERRAPDVAARLRARGQP
jgi:hypothetical protein